MKMDSGFALPVVALIGGAALGYCLAPREAEKASAPKEAGTPSRRVVSGDASAAKVNALNAKIKSLEAQLAAAKGEEKPAEDGEGRRGRRRRGEDGEDDRRGQGRPQPPSPAQMQQWAKEHPEQAAEFERMMQSRAQRRKEKSDFIASIDTSRMSDEDRAVHERVMQILARREELGAKMSKNDFADDGERDRAHNEMFALRRELRENSERERGILLGQVAGSLGLDGDAAGQFVDAIGQIYESTSDDHGRGGPGGWGWGGGGRRGGGGGRRGGGAPGPRQR